MHRVRFLFALERLGVSFINVDADELKLEFAQLAGLFPPPTWLPQRQ